MYLPMIDTLIASVDIQNYDDVSDKLIELLEAKKAQAKKAQADNSTSKVTADIGSMTFEVLPNGKKGYAYILHNDLYEVDIAQFRNRNQDFYPVFIKIKSECLWSYGPEQAWKQIINWIDENIGDIAFNKLSRIDLCCHNDEIYICEDDIDNFKGRFYTDCIRRYRRKVNGMYFGSSASGKVYCRIYNKVLEIQQTKSKTWFYDIWKKSGLKCNKVWNVEFQICREFLKDRNINTVEQAFESLQTIWKYCTEEWIVKIERDNDNVSRCSINQIWLTIQKAFEAYSSKELVKREKQLYMDAEAMIPATYGNITTYAAKLGMKDPLLALTLLNKGGERYLKSKNKSFRKVVTEKQQLLDSQILFPVSNTIN